MTPCHWASHRVPLTVLQELCTILPSSRGRALCHRQEEGMVVLGLPGSVPISAAPWGLSPSLCLGLAVSDGVAAAGFAGGAVRGPPPREALRGHVRPWGPCPGMPRAQGDGGCWGTGACSLPVLPVLTPLPAFLPGCSFSEFLGRVATANSLFLARVICTRWLCRVPTAGLRGVRCPPGTLLPAAVAPLAPALLGAWQAPAGTRAQPCDVPRSLLVSEEMRSLIVEKGPGPVEEDPDALVKGRRSATGFFFLPHPRVHSWG